MSLKFSKWFPILLRVKVEVLKTEYKTLCDPPKPSPDSLPPPQHVTPHPLSLSCSSHSGFLAFLVTCQVCSHPILISIFAQKLSHIYTCTHTHTFMHTHTHIILHVFPIFFNFYLLLTFHLEIWLK